MWTCILASIALFSLTLPSTLAQDDIGFSNGLSSIQTAHWDAKFIKDSGTLASLKPSGSDFDFLPYDLMLLGRRVQNGCYQWGDISLRYRTPNSNSSDWIDVNSAADRTPVAPINTTSSLLASDLSPTMPTGPLPVTREWLNVDGDLGLRFTIKNTGPDAVEIGSLGFAAAVNNIFTKRNTSDVNEKCSFMDPYIGLDAGYLRVTPLSGTGPVLVVTPLENTSTPLEAYRYLPEERHGDTNIGTNAFEGYFEWQVHSKAWAEKEWGGVEPWNPPSSVRLSPGEGRVYGLRFSVADGVRGIDAAVRKTGTPTALSVPGYIVPRDIEGRLFLQSVADVAAISVHPPGALKVTASGGNKTYMVQPASWTWGRVCLTIRYKDERTQTIHYYVTKPAPEAVGDLGRFLTTEHWFDDESDPFGRGPSIMGYDGEIGAIVEQDPRIQVPGLSDEAGAGAYVAAAIKQTFQPDAGEIVRLEEFVEKVLFKTVQSREDYSVKRSVFFYDPKLVPAYNYSSSLDWESSSGKDYTDEITRAYNYVWPAACYWSLYRAGRAYPRLLERKDWGWYLDQAYRTVMRGMQPDIGYNTEGLMGETVFGEILADLRREGKTDEAEKLETAMKNRVEDWRDRPYPFGSEQSWDSTGQEGVYFWARQVTIPFLSSSGYVSTAEFFLNRYFGEVEMATAAKNSVFGYMPTVPHWGYNGNARRYWDFAVAGKLAIQERQIHHYGSGLNALVMLSAFRDDPSDSYLLRVGYGGTSGPLANIHQNGFASCAMHAWPEHLFWDGYSGDYGPGFVGMVLGLGTYLVEDGEVGVVVYGGVMTKNKDLVTVQVRDPLRQKIFLGPLGVEIRIDAGIIEEFTYNLRTQTLSLILRQREDGPRANSAIVWVSPAASSTTSDRKFGVIVGGVEAGQERGGRKVFFTSRRVSVEVEQLQQS